MKPKADTRLLGMLAAGVVMIFSQIPFPPSSSGALYSSYLGAQSISDPAENSDGEGRHITQPFWTSDGTYPLFRLDPFHSFNNNRNDGSYFESGGNSPTSAAYFSADMEAYIMVWKVFVSTNFPSGMGTSWEATSGTGGSLKDISAPIPVAAWLFALGTLALVTLKRRKSTA